MNKLNASFSFEMGGAARAFVLNMNSICEVEQLLNVRLMQNQEFWAQMGFVELRALAHAMLHKETPRPELLVVGEWISDCDMKEFLDAITFVFAGDFKKSDGDDQGSPQEDPTKD